MKRGIQNLDIIDIQLFIIFLHYLILTKNQNTNLTLLPCNIRTFSILINSHNASGDKFNIQEKRNSEPRDIIDIQLFIIFLYVLDYFSQRIKI